MEECWAAQEHSGVECVITGKIFADVNDIIRFAFDLRSVVQVKDTIHIVIDCQNDLVICRVAAALAPWLFLARKCGPT